MLPNRDRLGARAGSSAMTDQALATTDLQSLPSPGGSG